MPATPAGGGPTTSRAPARGGAPRPASPRPPPPPPPPPRVRAATAADRDAIAALLRAAGGAPAARRGAAAAAARGAWAAGDEAGAPPAPCPAGRFPCLVAEHPAGAPAALLGVAYATPFLARPGWRWTVEATLRLRPGAGPPGDAAGRALLAALVGACVARGFRQMVAVLPAGAAGRPAAALHRALGFTRAGLLRGVVARRPGDGAPADAVLVQRALLGGGGGPSWPAA